MAVGSDEIDNDPEWKKVQLIEEETLRSCYCTICEVIFGDPKAILSWLHTFCKECLEESIKANITTPNIACCPACRAVVPTQHSEYLTDRRVKRLVTMINEQLETLEDSWKAGEGEFEPFRGCKNCDEDLPVVTWCVECRVTLCRGCNEIHGMWKEFRKHTLITTEDRLRDFMIKQHLRSVIYN